MDLPLACEWVHTVICTALLQVLRNFSVVRAPRQVVPWLSKGWADKAERERHWKVVVSEGALLEELLSKVQQVDPDVLVSRPFYKKAAHGAGQRCCADVLNLL